MWFLHSHNSWHPTFHRTFEHRFEHRIEIDLSKNRKCLVNVEAFIGNTIGSDSELDWIFIDSRRRENFWDRPIQDRTMEHLKPKIPNIKDFIIATTTKLQSGYKDIVSTCVCVGPIYIQSKGLMWVASSASLWREALKKRNTFCKILSLFRIPF